MKIVTQGEIGAFKNCCCCIPLRYGLLGWGYLKLIGYAVMMVNIVKTLSLIENGPLITEKADKELKFFPQILAGLVLDLIVNSADFIVNIVFIIGLHKKNPKLISVSYYMCMVVCVYMIFRMIWTVWFMIANDLSEAIYMLVIYILIALTLQIYIILLVRNEIIKLQKQQAKRTRYNAS